MRNLPFAAQLILQEMRHYRLILKLEEMNLPDLDTDAYMIGLFCHEGTRTPRFQRLCVSAVISVLRSWRAGISLGVLSG